MAIKILNALIAVIGGIGRRDGPLLGCSTSSPSCCPGRWEDRVKPYLYILPALAAIGALPDLPGDPDGHVQLRQRRPARRTSASRTTPTCSADDGFLQTLFNTLLWIIIVPAVTVVLGLRGRRARRPARPAGREDRRRRSSSCRWRSAWSARRRSGGSSTTPRPPGQPQIGLLNAIVGRLRRRPGRLAAAEPRSTSTACC